jgi:hypothetical protein
VADQVTAWPRRPMVCRSPEANSGGNGQSAETAGHQEEGETVRENLAGRRCPDRKKRRIRTRVFRKGRLSVDRSVVAVARDGAQVVAPGSLRVSLPSQRCVRNAAMIDQCNPRALSCQGWRQWSVAIRRYLWNDRSWRKGNIRQINDVGLAVLTTKKSVAISIARKATKCQNSPCTDCEILRLPS